MGKLKLREKKKKRGYFERFPSPNLAIPQAFGLGNEKRGESPRGTIKSRVSNRVPKGLDMKYNSVVLSL